MNNFVAPDDGTYYVEITGDGGRPVQPGRDPGADFNTQPDNQLSEAQDITATELSGDNKLGGVLGYLTSRQRRRLLLGQRQCRRQPGTSPPRLRPADPGEFVNTLYPELLLFDPNGNLVAVAAGNASDGRNSVIDFTVPDGDAGTWTIEVTSSPNTPLSLGRVRPPGHRRHRGPVALRRHRQPLPRLAHSSSRRPTSSSPSTTRFWRTSLTPGELEVNGVSATAVTLVNANTVDWSVPASAFATGIDLPNVVTIGADAYGDQVTDVSGQTLTPYSYTFFTTNVAPVIVSSSIDGQVFSPAPADVTEVVTFNQPMDTSFTTSSSFSLYGNYHQRLLRGRVV